MPNRRYFVPFIFIPLALLVCSCAPRSSANLKSSQGPDDELREGARAFQAKHYDEAKVHFEKARDLDPLNQKAILLSARVSHFLYEPGDQSAINNSRADDARQAYERVLVLDPKNEEALSAVISLLDSRGEKDEALQLAVKSANNQAMTAALRAKLFAFIAQQKFFCSSEITEMNKQTVQRKDGALVVQFKKPINQADYDTALQCADQGLELTEKAISLDPDSAMGWSLKEELLNESAKLAKMDGDETKAADYQKLAEDARNKSLVLSHREQDAASPEPIVKGNDLDSLVPPVTPTIVIVRELPPIPTKL